MTDTVKLTAAGPPGNAGLPGALWPVRSAVAIARAAEVCRLTGRMGLVTGPSGIGKTTAARAIVAELEEAGSQARLVMMTRAADGLQTGLLRIGKAIGAFVQPNMGGADIYDALAEHLRSHWARGDVLILDEAQFMSEALLDAVRNLSDELRGAGLARGVVMVGTPDLAARIEGKLGGRAKHFEPMRGRLYLDSVERLEAEDFEAIARRLGLAGEKAPALLARIAAGRGGLHNLERVMEAADKMARRAGKPLSLDTLRVALQGLGVAA
jgi:type II secretory pathway predicted ATPase ExeA